MQNQGGDNCVSGKSETDHAGNWRTRQS